MTLRVFFALWPDIEAAGRLLALAQQQHASLGGRVMREDTLHATLVFIGDVSPDRLPALQSAADGIRVSGFNMMFDRIACWRHNHIAYLGMGQIPDPLQRLQSGLADNLRNRDFSVESRPFSPHVTLLRKADCAKFDQANLVKEDLIKENPATKPVVWSVRDFVLVKSSSGANGSRYEQIGRWRLL